MATVFEKLNFRGQPEMVVLNAPESFEQELAKLSTVFVHRSPSQAEETTFLLAFFTRKSEYVKVRK